MDNTLSKLEFLRKITGIRVNLSWVHVLTGFDITFESQEIHQLNEFGEIFTPWCRDIGGNYCDWNSDNAEPMCVKASSEFTGFPDDIGKHFKFHKGIYSQNIPPEISFPAYRLPENKFLLLDGNHRATELYRAYIKNPNLQFHRINLHVVCGPICQSVLPDLKHWQK